jgi:hypothetical protein
MSEFYNDLTNQWEESEQDNRVKFARRQRRRSVLTTCRQCGDRVKLPPEYDLCNRCADFNEGI